MLKTLIIAPYYPLPENTGGNMRTMNFVRFFQKLGSVDMMFHNGQNHVPLSGSPFLNEYFIDWSNISTNKISCFRRVINKLVHKQTWITSHFTPESVQLIRKIIDEGEYDYVVCRYISQAYPLLKLSKEQMNKVILDVDDIVTETIYDLETAHLTGLSRINTALDKRILQSYYKQCMNLGHILFCSDDDKSKVTDQPTTLKCYVVPNTCPQIQFPTNYLVNGFPNINKLLFVGSLGYEPNYQGIIWFIQEALPQILVNYRDIKLLVVGRHPPDMLISLIKQHPNIELHADPPDVAPFYDKCGVVVVPLFAGGGTRIKILESGIASRPVISTEIGAYGLGLAKGKEIMIFNDSDSFVDAYRKLRNDEALYSSMVEKFSKTVASKYSFDTFCKSMDAVVDNR